MSKAIMDEAFRKKLFAFLSSLDELNLKKFDRILTEYFFRYDNSEVFRERCRRINEHGGDDFLLYLKQKGFRPSFRL